MRPRNIGLAVGGLAIALAIAAAGPVAATSKTLNNWHIHDGVAAPGHAPIGSFWRILGYDANGDGVMQATERAAYTADPATCPNATDKILLGPSGPLNGDQVIRAGVCFTSDLVIQLRTIHSDDIAPAGWSILSSGGGETTYYRLTEK